MLYNLSRKTLIQVVLIVIAVSFCYGFYTWYQYLSNHFVGSFDEYGLPSQATNRGWEMFIHAWHLWFWPLCWGILLVILSFLLFYSSNTENTRVSFTYHEEKPTPSVKKNSGGHMQDALQVESLRKNIRMLETQKEIIAKEKAIIEKNAAVAEQLASRQKTELAEKTAELELLKVELQEKQEEITRAQSLIDLLREHIEKPNQDE